MYTIRYNRTTNHISGIEIRSTDEYTMNACGSLTRSNLAQGKSFETAAEALEAARKGGRKLCKNCEKAALAQIEAEEAAETETAETAETTVHVDVVAPGKALVTLSDCDGGTLLQDGNGWWHAEDTYGTGRTICSAKQPESAARVLAGALGVRGPFRVILGVG